MLNYLTLALVFALLSESIAAESAMKLRAATPKAALRTRDIDFRPTLSPVELLYIDDNSILSSLPVAARVLYEPRLPTLLLDDYRQEFSDIFCTESKIVLSFHDLDSMHTAHSSWTNGSEFLLITSESCPNDQGAHRIYKASGTTLMRDVLEIPVTETSLRTSSDNVQMEFGTHVYHDHFDGSMLNRRNAHEALLDARDTYDPTTLPYPTPTNKGSRSSVSQSIATSFIDTNIIPPSEEIAKIIEQHYVPKGIDLRCVNCTTTGSLELSDGDFGFSTDTGTDMTGYINFFAKDVTAHVELDLALAPGFAPSYVAQLPPIPIPYLSIPGFDNATIGVFLIMEIVMGFHVDKPLEMSTGFEVTIPSESEIHVDLGNPDNSYSHGFANAKIHSLPFNMHEKPLAFMFYAGLQPHLQLQISVDNDIGTADAEAGIYLDSPKIKVAVDKVSGVNEHCEPTTNHPVDHPLIKIAPTAVVDVGWDASATIDQEQLGADLSWATAAVFAHTAYPLPTACLDFDPSTNQLESTAASDGVRALGGGTGSPGLLALSLIVSLSASMLVWM